MALKQTPTLALAVANLRAGRLVASRQGFAEAFEIAKRAHDQLAMAEAALGLGGMWVHEHRTFEEREGYLARIEMARDAVRGLSPELLDRLDVRHRAELVYVGKGSDQMVREAIERVRLSNDPAAEAEALSLLHHVILSPERGTERFIVAEQLMAAAARSGDEYYGALALMWHTVDLFMSGSPFAERELEALRIRSQRAENLAIAFIVATLDVTLAIRSGNLTRAEELAGVAFSLGIECGDADAEAFLGGQLLCCRWLQGTSGDLLAAGRRLQNSPSVHFANPLFSAAVAVMAAETGKIDESRRAIALTWAMLKMSPIAGVSSVQLATYFALGEAAAILGDRVTARLVLEYLEPFAELPITGSLAVSCFGSTWRSIALAHRTLGNVDSAINGWRCAIDNNIRIGHLPMVAICRAELARILVDEVCDADGEVVKQLSEAIRIGTVCGLSLRVKGWRNSINTTIGLRPPVGPLSIADRSGSLQRTLDGWTMVCVLGSVVVPLRKGMEYLAVLLQSPGTSISIAELVGATAAPRQLVLDTQAQSNLRIRVRDLQSELDEALVLSDPTTSAAVRAELECIADEVERSTGLFGRSRAFVDDSERARTAVQKSIKRVLDEIEAQAPVLGGELRKAIRTGSRCTFVPTETLPARWVLHRADPQERRGLVE